MLEIQIYVKHFFEKMMEIIYATLLGCHYHENKKWLYKEEFKMGSERKPPVA